MNNSNKVSLKLEGASSTDGLARLDHFASLLQSLKQCLRAVERCVTEKKSGITYKIVGLQLSSALLEVEPIKNGVPDSVRAETVSLFNNTVKCLEEGKGIDPRINRETLLSLKKLHNPLNAGAASVNVSGAVLSNNFLASIEKNLSMDYTSIGTVKGLLEDLLTHNRRRFVLYAPIRGTKIDCDFPDEMYEDVIKAIGKNVTISGTMTYVKGEPFPKHVDVTSIEVHPSDDELPKLSDMAGIIADIEKTDSISAVRRVRNEY